jgi:hypothetical protein
VSVLFSKLRAPAAPPTERRRSIRHAAVLQVAKIRLADRREELCVLRDISPEGLRAEIYCPAAPGDLVEIELRTGHVIAGRVAWREEATIGVAFDEAMPMKAVLAHCSFDDRVATLRPPRLTVDFEAWLDVDGDERLVRVGNVSQAGLQISSARPIEAGTACRVALPGLPARNATVRWWRQREGGLQLDATIDYAEFAAWRGAQAA